MLPSPSPSPFSNPAAAPSSPSPPSHPCTGFDRRFCSTPTATDSTGPPAAAPARPRATVIHCHNAPPAPGTYDIYIGSGIGATRQRWGLDCPWRSPFTITGTANRTARQTAQNRHREWLHRPEQSALCARARRELRGLRLGCWCEQPGPCHGHNLCEVADADIDDDADGTAP